MSFNGEYFQQNFGVIMGTNVAPILANIYMATLENLLKEKSKTNTKIIWPVLFKRFIDDGFGITEANKEEFEFWIHKFNLLRETITIDKFKYENVVDFMDLYVFKGVSFFLNTENWIFRCIKKKKTNICISLLIVVIKNIPSIILSEENYIGMFILIPLKETLQK